MLSDEVEDYYDLTVPRAGCYFDAQGIVHHNSGKDTCAAIAQLYTVYRLTLLPNPQAWIGLGQGSTIDLINVAYNAKQAKLVYFQLVKNYIRQSPYFMEALPGFNPGKDVQADFIRFPHDIFAHSLHSQVEAAEGKNTFLGVMDEADAFTDEAENSNAEKVHDGLKSSMESRCPNQHLLLDLSWPREEESFTIRLYQKSRDPTSRVYGNRGATWEIRTDRTREDFDDAYKRNPERAAAMFETLPPAAVDAFFRLPDKIDEALTGVDLIQWEPTTLEVNAREYVGVNIINLTPAQEDASYWLHGDAGLTGDSYGLAMTRADPGGRKYVEGLMAWEPEPGKPVYFPDVERVILLLNQTYTIQGVTFDRWNSAGTIQILQTMGINAEALTFSQPQQLEFYETLKEGVYGNNVSLPKTGLKVADLRRELRRLQLLKGRRVDHPAGESKDLADCVAASCYYARYIPRAELGAGPVSAVDHPEAIKALEAGGFNADLLRRQW